jgi:hypothetical protein
MKNRDLARILSPLLFFGFHIIYLVTSSPDPFLKKWLEGSFTFFLALVLCNIIRARIVASKNQGESAVDDQDGRDR